MLSLKLTPTAVQNALNVVSPEGLLTLSLRNRRILYIENLEFTNDAFSVIDLTNNEIVELSGIPKLINLEVLLLANNNISRVGLVAPCGLRSLLLMNNNLSSFSEIAKLRPLNSLENLTLDCQKVKPKERTAANELFGPDFETRLPAADVLLNGENTAEPVLKDVRLMETTMRKLLPEEKALLVKELENSTSMEEIERISKALKEGYVGTSGTTQE
ncbi:hypothetical protein HF325_002001 [Metschnikowia pulcherrima]|uniref:U2 small nuclear ribonucleoprotein A' n=1 Tax=Metschnikowia pulcherrima TaxID=27326 RepID=A0A8H7LAF1_9ASCO|nr:hypothetical protein HF325_002001 [Metschnikowia pulcherrima]